MKIDHYGIVVQSISEHIKLYLPPWLDGKKVGPIIHEPLQKANVAFLPVAGGRIELIEPTSDDSSVAKILKKRGSHHDHICFEVEDLDGILEASQKKGMLVVSPPKPSVAFGGRRVAFVMSRDPLLWELLEK